MTVFIHEFDPRSQDYIEMEMTDEEYAKYISERNGEIA